MPKTPEYIAVPAVISKAEIRECVEQIDCTNAFHLSLNGVKHEPKTVRFVTFGGTRHDDGKFHGKHFFEAGNWKDLKPAPLNGLPGLNAKIADHHQLESSEEVGDANAHD